MRKNVGINSIALITLLFIGLPLIMIATTAFGEAAVIQFPIQGFTFKWFGDVLNTRSLMTSLWTSVRLAVIASMIGLMIGLPTSYALTKNNSKMSQRLLSFFLSPNLVPGIVMGFALFKTLTLTFRLTVWTSLILGHLMIVLPYTIRILAASMRELDPSIEEAARSLGCKPVETFIRVVIPNLKGSIFAALIMSFINSFNNLPVSLFLKGPGVNTLPAALMNHLEYNFNPTVSALSVILMVITFVMMLLIEKTIGLSEVR
ncbi:spermidine/putrescine ABC transporter ATP-binding protein [Erysipelothrix larvae]|uniref:Spermidine/putrescine ABC transporter ATP-binding protein n=1 Tax=Erysipelothrix larvae TaxID=1514105 RepID=A0A120JTP3_9FIRM|nr:ABC transporter permease [Erysipelothrix larvae]AMC93480.1 spermidine/putrescine ABC transporter ATP-binding protein [Erysipelothrix larvae]